MQPKTCEQCNGTGWYGDNGPGIIGNAEFWRCDCGTGDMCAIGMHDYELIGKVPWCRACNREAVLSVCRMKHVLPDEKEKHATETH